jgi:hypothetical protein
MVPDKYDPRWKDLLTGKIRHEFKFAAASMCLARNMREIAAEHTPERIARGVDEVHTLCAKYEKLIADDLVAIFGK